MTPAISKVIFVGLVIVWYLIRYEYARRSRREKVVSTARGPLETALLSGLGLVPLLYVATAIPRFAGYTFYPSLTWLGSFFAIAALGMFYLTHRALGRNWSISLDVRENHELVTNGIYRRVRHPMYGRIAREERMMLETFGDSYRAYMARTGRIFPSIH
jgi:protein-S-isoprenylcysteine O-methyltransferase Ste14